MHRPLPPEQARLLEETATAVVDQALAEPLDGLRFILLSAEWAYEAGSHYLRLFVERADERLGLAISLDQCAHISLRVDPLLEAALPVPSGVGYHLEVSSPGLFRELTREREFAFYQGCPVQVLDRTPPELPKKGKQARGGKKPSLAMLPTPQWAGTLTQFDANARTVTITAPDSGAIRQFSLESVRVQLNPTLRALADEDEADALIEPTDSPHIPQEDAPHD